MLQKFWNKFCFQGFQRQKEVVCGKKTVHEKKVCRFCNNFDFDAFILEFSFGFLGFISRRIA